MLPSDDSPAPPVLFHDPIVRAECGGVPIYAYGYTWVLGASPDLTDAAPLQVDNAAPRAKMALKSSDAISANRLGVNASRMPHSPATDELPLEAIHLIDGDAQTCWCSHAVTQADAEPAWIRLDLPVERTITRIVLRKRPPGIPRVQGVGNSMGLEPGAVEIGMAMPAQLEIALSGDAKTWTPVFAGASADTPDCREFTCTFPPRRAKQILITGRNLPRVENWLFSFSIAGVEVYDDAGQNVALATRGTGVTVSSTQHNLGQTLEAHRWFWPMQRDLGVKWVRLGYHDDQVNWHWVERERGVLKMDPESDAAISYLADHGINTVLALGFGNRLYTHDDPARQLPQLWEWYYDNPLPPTTPAALAAWGRYVRFIARHFRDRVRHFEIWNEWNCDLYFGGPWSVERYLAIVRVALPILREECPEAVVSLGGVAGFPHGFADWSPAQRGGKEGAGWNSGWLAVLPHVARDIDMIQWHPFYQPDPTEPRVRSYTRDVQAFQAHCRALGFRGEFVASEWNVGANYPPPPLPNWWGSFTCSELEKAKYVARITLEHVGLGVTSIFCEEWNAYYSLDLSLLRRTVGADPIPPQQPQAAYYVMRNLATALEALEPATFDYRISGGPTELVACTLARPGARVLACWQSGLAHDDCPGTPCDIRLPGRYRAITALDPLNGVTQPLTALPDGDFTRLPGVLVRDYPLLIIAEA